MKLGTKSLLWGAHAFFLHPLQVVGAGGNCGDFRGTRGSGSASFSTMWDISSAIGWMAMAAKSM